MTCLHEPERLDEVDDIYIMYNLFHNFEVPDIALYQFKAPIVEEVPDVHQVSA